MQNYIGTAPEKLTGQVPTSTPTAAIKDPILKTRALEFFGKRDLRVVERPKPMISHPKDAIVKITVTTVCGSDLHLFHREIPELKKVGLTCAKGVRNGVLIVVWLFVA